MEIRQVLREVFFLGAKEIDAAGKKAICVYVPVPQQKQFQKIQVLTRGGTTSSRPRAMRPGRPSFNCMFYIPRLLYVSRETLMHM